MKKITRKDFQGLRQHYPVLTKEEMRRYVGGNSDNYWDSDWLAPDLYLSDFGVNVWSSGGYGGYDGGGVIDGGYLDEVVIYGSQGGNSYGEDYLDGGYLDEVVIYGGQSGNPNPYGGNGYPDWGSGSYWDDGFGYGTYGYNGSDGGGNKRGDIINAPWACMFNCMNFINPSKSADEYYRMYLQKSQGKDPSKNGGLYNTERNDALNACGFSFEETKVINPSGGYQYIAVVNTVQGESHATIVTAKDGDLVTVYDPSMQGETKSYQVNINRVGTLYRVKK